MVLAMMLRTVMGRPLKSLEEAPYLATSKGVVVCTSVDPKLVKNCSVAQVELSACHSVVLRLISKMVGCSPFHADLVAVAKGTRMRCSNRGVSFVQVESVLHQQATNTRRKVGDMVSIVCKGWKLWEY